MKIKDDDIKVMTRYLRDIAADEKIAGRIDEVISFYKKIMGVDLLKDIFVSDSVAENGSRQYGSLWLFYENFICEAKGFLAENDFDFSNVTKNSIIYWRMQAKDFDFETASEGSKIGFRVDFNNRVNCELSATGKNCEHFMTIFRKYFSDSRDDRPVSVKEKQSLV